MDIIDGIETLLEESRVRQGEAREQIFKALGQLFGLIFRLGKHFAFGSRGIHKKLGSHSIRFEMDVVALIMRRVVVALVGAVQTQFAILFHCLIG